MRTIRSAAVLFFFTVGILAVAFGAPPSEATGIPGALAPKGVIYPSSPLITFTWSAVKGAKAYRFVLKNSKGQIMRTNTYRAAGVRCASGTGKCSLRIGISMSFFGSYKWWVRAYAPRKWSKWSAKASLTIASKSLRRPALFSPGGTHYTTTPDYVWYSLRGALLYKLAVKNSSGKLVSIKLYTAAQAKCSRASRSWRCLAPSAVVLKYGRYKWWVRAYSGKFKSKWSNPKVFFIKRWNGRPVTISPKGTITDQTPTYVWKAIKKAIRYWLVLRNSANGRVFSVVYSPAIAHCAKGTGRCYVTPGRELRAGAYNWYLRAKLSGSTWGKRSKLKRFVVKLPPLAAPKLRSPANGSITLDTTPVFSWYAVKGATLYRLNVYDSGGYKYNIWYSALAAHCRAGTGFCTATPATGLYWGKAKYRVKAYNGKSSRWSGFWSFTITTSNPAPRIIAPKGWVNVKTFWPLLSFHEVRAKAGQYETTIWLWDATRKKWINTNRGPNPSSDKCTGGICKTIVGGSIGGQGNFAWSVRARYAPGVYTRWSPIEYFKVFCPCP